MNKNKKPSYNIYYMIWFCIDYNYFIFTAIAKKPNPTNIPIILGIIASALPEPIFWDIANVDSNTITIPIPPKIT